MTSDSTLTRLIEQGLALERSGQISLAYQTAHAAVELARTIGDANAVALALTCLATVQFRLGHYDQVGALAQEALTLAGPDAPATAEAWLLLGMRATETDDLSGGEEYYRRSIDLSRQIGQTRTLIHGLHNMSAGIYMPRGQFDLSLSADEEALRLTNEHDLPALAWWPLTTMSWVCWLTGRYERAHTILKQLRDTAPIGSLAEGYYHCTSANLALDEGAIDQAATLYTQARSIGESIGAPDLSVFVRFGLSRYYRVTGQSAAARAYAHDALIIAQRIGYHHLQGMALIERGRAAWSLGDGAAARSDFEAAITILHPLRADFDLACACLLLAAVLHQSRQTEAQALWLEAVSRIISGGYAFLLEQERAVAFPLLAEFLNDPTPEVARVSTTLLNHLSRVPPPTLHVTTLGSFEVLRHSQPIEKNAWRQRKAGELFRLLLIASGRTLSREQIIEALWPDKSAASAWPLFHRATSALRRVLEPDLPDRFPSRYLEVEEGRVTLHCPIGSEIDFETFEQHARHGRLGQALDLYRGDLLPDDRYADWAAASREHLNQVYLRVLLAQATVEWETERFEQALDLCQRILAIEPWHERAALIGMKACLALNDRPGALRLYRDLEHTLRNDLGIAPLPELRDFHRTLLN